MIFIVPLSLTTWLRSLASYYPSYIALCAIKGTACQRQYLLISWFAKNTDTYTSSNIYYLMGEKAIWLDIARVCGRIFTSRRQVKIQHECGMVISSHICTSGNNYLARNVASYKIVKNFDLIRNRTESYKKLCFI